MNQCAQNIYSIKNTKLPSDTIKELDGYDVDNFSLKLNKCVNFIYNEKDKDKKKYLPALYRPKHKVKKDDDKFENFNIEFKFENFKKIIKRLNNRQNIIKERLRCRGYGIKTIKLMPEWRMAIGLGNESVYETSMTLHHIYGIPYIPGSAIKGVARSYCINNIYNKIGLTDIKQINLIEKILEKFDIENDKKLSYKAFKGKFTLLNDKKKIEPEEDLFKYFCNNDIEIINFKNIFGTLGGIGKIIFFDAYPTETPKIEPDIMNVHYPDYYGGGNPPTDYQNPIPIYFLTVKETSFEFTIGIKAKNDSINQDDKCLLELAYDNIKEALSKHGIGAKTAVGYGYFEVSEKQGTEVCNKNEASIL